MEIIKKVTELLENNSKAALATVINTVDSTPGKVGFKMVVTEDGETFGTVGGGCVEAGIWAVAKQVMDTGQPEVVNFTLKGEVVSCGGRIRIFVEPIECRNFKNSDTNSKSEILNSKQILNSKFQSSKQSKV